ncbi:MAG TPA: decaprenyl-phosphate phosphoribosyltransferase [Candidatus Paceibacterota bacterium]|nr:decaprenyl-phosphate phosphoribosyltransferase [Candidatus Paceibacterota bacterium]
MPRFADLNVHAFAGALVIVDVDGTITHDAAHRIDSDAQAKLLELARVSEVYLCSNGPDVARTRAIAQSLPGIRYLDSIHKKPDVRVVENLANREGKRLVVVGDKYITDGRFAQNIGAEFIQVARMRGTPERTIVFVIYLFEDTFTVIRNAYTKLRAVVSLMRTRQWIKNALVFAPLFFAQEALSVTRVESAAEAAAIFCLTASTVYIMNDLLDLEADRAHPIKRMRPIASGMISIPSAWTLCIVLGVFTIALTASFPAIIPAIVGYVGLNILYSRFLKHVAILDILCVASFYLLRILAGGEATATRISPWIILCVFFGALFLIIGKRRAEMAHASRRKVIEAYSPLALDYLLAGSAFLAVISYSIYSVIGSRSDLAVYSTIFVVCAMFRLLNRMYTSQNGEAEFPESLLFKDPWAFGSFIAWAVYMFGILYLA